MEKEYNENNCLELFKEVMFRLMEMSLSYMFASNNVHRWIFYWRLSVYIEIGLLRAEKVPSKRIFTLGDFRQYKS